MERQTSLLKNLESHFNLVSRIPEGGEAASSSAAVNTMSPLAIHIEELIRKSISDAMVELLKKILTPEQVEQVSEIANDIETGIENGVEEFEDVAEDILDVKEKVVEEGIELIEKLMDPLPDELEDEIKEKFLDRIVSTEKKINLNIKKMGLTIRNFPGLHQSVEILKGIRQLLTPTLQYRMEVQHRYLNHPNQKDAGSQSSKES